MKARCVRTSDRGWTRFGLAASCASPSPERTLPVASDQDCTVTCPPPPGQRQARLCFPCSSLVLGYWSPFWSFFPGILEIDLLTAVVQLGGQRVGEGEHRACPWSELRGQNRMRPHCGLIQASISCPKGLEGAC